MFKNILNRCANKGGEKTMAIFYLQVDEQTLAFVLFPFLLSGGSKSGSRTTVKIRMNTMPMGIRDGRQQPFSLLLEKKRKKNSLIFKF